MLTLFYPYVIKLERIELFISSKLVSGYLDNDIEVAEALALADALPVDVRSEDEYLADTIPGAVNIPILHNEERAAVGLTYRQEGEAAAFELGLRLVAPQLEEKLRAAKNAACGRSLAVFCWRGGKRSKEVADFFSRAGLSVYRINGGYKAYRKHVLEFLERKDLPLRGIVLHGLTGVGKTQALTELAQRGLPVLDLEGIANHRGSVYGKIGLPPSPSQKAFESKIVALLKEAVPKGFFLVECESRRIGNLLTPPMVLDFIRQGARILLYCSPEQRIKRIHEIYAGFTDEHVAALQEATAGLRRQLGRARVEELNNWLQGKEYDRVIAFMLEHHYDPLYNYPAKPAAGYDLCVNTDDMAAAVDRIFRFATDS